MKHLSFILGAASVLAGGVFAMNDELHAALGDSKQVIPEHMRTAQIRQPALRARLCHVPEEYVETKDFQKHHQRLTDVASHQLPTLTRQTLEKMEVLPRPSLVCMVLQAAGKWTEAEILQAPRYFADVGIAHDEIEAAFNFLDEANEPLKYILRLDNLLQGDWEKLASLKAQFWTIYKDADAAAVTLDDLLRRNQKKILQKLLAGPVENTSVFLDVMKASFKLELYDLFAILLDRVSQKTGALLACGYAIEFNRPDTLRQFLTKLNPDPVQIMKRYFSDITGKDPQLFQALLDYGLEVTTEMLAFAAKNDYRDLVELMLQSDNIKKTTIKCDPRFFEDPDILKIILNSKSVVLSDTFFKDSMKALQEKSYIDFETPNKIMEVLEAAEESRKSWTTEAKQ